MASRNDGWEPWPLYVAPMSSDESGSSGDPFRDGGGSRRGSSSDPAEEGGQPTAPIRLSTVVGARTPLPALNAGAGRKRAAEPSPSEAAPK
jgi:hypothetical protein